MDRLKLCSIAIFGSTMLAATCAAHANDSAAELSIGGLQFVRTNDIAMESEDLRISLDRVTVRYQFANTSGKSVTLTVAFPLPDIDLSEAENIALPSADPINFVDFETRIDGVPAQFQIDQRAMVGDRDVSTLLDQFKLPRLPVGSHEIRVADLPEATRTRLADQGLLMPVRTDDKGRQQYDLGLGCKNIRRSPADISSGAQGHRRAPVQAERWHQPRQHPAMDSPLQQISLP